MLRVGESGVRSIEERAEAQRRSISLFLPRHHTKCIPFYAMYKIPNCLFKMLKTLDLYHMSLQGVFLSNLGGPYSMVSESL